MPLTAGTRLGVYEVVSAIGAGGMGEVYRATDTKLKRQVAIKILPPAVATDQDRLARFQREAEVLASLNHPNISHIYGLDRQDGQDGTTFIVMELVEGDDLSQRIARGPVPIDEALPIAKQIAEALEAAHEQGIVHRDLKPANIKVRADGTVKVLDFGLAKAVGPSNLGPYDPGTGGRGGLGVGAELAPPEMSPTITTPAMMTGVGMILGTAAYMSPEQAKGRPADKRSDIWSFGCVLFEMITGKRAFEGEDVADTLAAVLRAEPDWTRLPPATPPALERLLRRSLVRERRERLADVADVRLELLDALSPRDTAARAAAPVLNRRVLATAAAVLVAAGGASGVALSRWTLRDSSAAARNAVTFGVTPPPGTRFASGVSGGLGYTGGAISPDGRLLAFAARDDAGAIHLFVRPLNTLSVTRVSGTDGAGIPFWSPDSRSIAFFTDRELKRVPAAGGPVETICAVTGGRGGAWNDRDVILFGSLNGPISRVSAGGGQATAVTSLSQGQNEHRDPSFLPDGDHFLFFAAGQLAGNFVGSLTGQPAPEEVAVADTKALYAPTGQLLFVRQGVLFAQPFDPGRRRVAGEATSLATGVATASSGAFSVSANGVLSYRTGPAASTHELSWFDRTGQRTGSVTNSAAFEEFDLSRDDKRIVARGLVPGGADLWVVEVADQKMARVTFAPAADHRSPIWSPDASQIAYAALVNGHWAIRIKNLTSGTERTLTDGLASPRSLSWSPDGRTIIYTEQEGPKRRLRSFDVSAGSGASATTGDWNEDQATFSPDGEWLAYESDQTGRSEVYVRAFAQPLMKWQLSTKGGQLPRWSRDGKELLYVEGQMNQRTVMAVAVRPARSGFEWAAPRREFFAGRLQATARAGFAMASSGQLLVNAMPDLREFDAVPITVVKDWPSLLKK